MRCKMQCCELSCVMLPFDFPRVRERFVESVWDRRHGYIQIRGTETCRTDRSVHSGAAQEDLGESEAPQETLLHDG